MSRSLRSSPPNALCAAEPDAIITAFTGPRFGDKSVTWTCATLLDNGVYLASMMTMNRLLGLIGARVARRNPAAHPAGAGPELMATGPG